MNKKLVDHINKNEALRLIRRELRRICDADALMCEINDLQSDNLLTAMNEGMPVDRVAAAALASVLNQRMMNGPPCDCPHDFHVKLFHRV
jgi:hypothetical protein